MKVNREKLLKKLEIINITELAKFLGVVRSAVYYHIYNLKAGKNTFKENTIKKIGIFICDDENAFFV